MARIQVAGDTSCQKRRMSLGVLFDGKDTGHMLTFRARRNFWPPAIFLPTDRSMEDLTVVSEHQEGADSDVEAWMELCWFPGFCQLTLPRRKMVDAKIIVREVGKVSQPIPLGTRSLLYFVRSSRIFHPLVHRRTPRKLRTLEAQTQPNRKTRKICIPSGWSEMITHQMLSSSQSYKINQTS